MSNFAEAMKQQQEAGTLEAANIPPVVGQSEEKNQVLFDERPDAPLAVVDDQSANPADGGEPDAPANDTPAPDAPKIDDTFIKELFEDFDGNVDALKERVKGYKQRYTEYETLQGKVKEYEEIVPKITNPFVNDTIKTLNQFVAKTGINDISLAAKYAGKTADEIMKSPVEAIAFKRVVSNPDILKVASFEDIKSAVAQQFSVDENITLDESPATLKLEVADAAKDLQSKLVATDDDADVFTKLAAERNNSKAAYEKYVSEVSPKVSSIVSGLSELKFDLDGGVSLACQVSDNVKRQVEEEMRQWVLSQGIAIDEKVEAQLAAAAVDRSKQLMVDDLLKQAVKSTKGAALKETLKEVENGQPIKRGGAQVQQAAAQDDWAKNWLAKKGK